MSGVSGGYRAVKNDDWVLWVDEATWREGWWQRVEEWMTDMPEVISSSRHAQTSRLLLPDGRGGTWAFLKVYCRAGRGGDFKDIWRPSKARRALRMSLALARDGFGVPHALAVGERRRKLVLSGAFLLTEEVVGVSLHRAAATLHAPSPKEQLRRKRCIARALGAEVARMHSLGYVHGDLVATNVLVRGDAADRFCFLDHDRTRRAGPVAGTHFQRRNLVQLNRIPIDGVTHTDRLRAFLAYANARGWTAGRVHNEARRLARKTVARRVELARLGARRS